MIRHEDIVRIVCADYQRRKRILDPLCPTEGPPIYDDTMCLYRILNRFVDEAIEAAYKECRSYVPHFAEIMIDDIAECRGYNNTAMRGAMCDSAYKKYKRMVKESIEKRLGL